MVNFAVGIILLLMQLSGPGAGLPQVMEPNYSEKSIPAGETGKVKVSFDVKEGYVINRIPPIQLKLKGVEGLTLTETSLISSSEDPKSTDEYYVNVPTFDVVVMASKVGTYEIPTTLVYFFCSKADGFCSRQVVNTAVKVSVH